MPRIYLPAISPEDKVALICHDFRILYGRHGADRSHSCFDRNAREYIPGPGRTDYRDADSIGIASYVKTGAIMDLTHIDESGHARMVDVTDKPETVRRAVAYGEVHAKPATIQQVVQNEIAKGDVVTVAKVAGINAAKQTGSLIPMCHPILLSHVDLDFSLDPTQGLVTILASATATGKTGIEMEAMAAVSVAALTIYDMCKAIDRTMTITSVMLVEKHGGKSGSFQRPGWTPPGK